MSVCGGCYFVDGSGWRVSAGGAEGALMRSAKKMTVPLRSGGAGGRWPRWMVVVPARVAVGSG